MENTISKEELNELYAWVVSPIYGGNTEELRKIILDKYNKLPECINENEQKTEYSLDYFLKELVERVEYSNPITYLILNKGRKYLHLLWIILALILMVILFSFGSIFRLFNINFSDPDTIPVIVFCTIVLILVLEKINDKVFDILIKKMKPGDILKILFSKDEVILKNVKSASIKEDNIFQNPSVKIGVSKKKLICEYYRDIIKNENRNLYNLMVNFMATFYLITNEGNNEVKEYLMEDSIEILKYILAFRSDSVFSLYYLSFYQLELLKFEEAEDTMKKFKKIRSDEIDINAWLIILDFIKECSKPNIA
ncbi:hypothetical protein AGMMS49587_10340 [Spirochaetia bacterium]|nr:hypothetical protein AGMMS49587_10340 [Spirochaetia bacterium]